MSSTRGDAVSQGVQHLATRMVDSKAAVHLQPYLMRILAARLAPAIEADESGLVAHMKKAFIRENKQHGPALAQQFATLHRVLCETPILANRWSILYLLFTLRVKRVSATGLDSGFDSLSSSGMLGLPVFGFETKPAPLPSTTVPKGIPLLPRPVEETSDSNTPGSDDIVHYQLEPFLTFEESEQLLIRDLVFVFQDIGGSYIKFNESLQSYTLLPTVKLPRATRDLVLQMAELGWLYRKVGRHVTEVVTEQAGGLVEQAMAASLQRELVDYYRLVAILEAQINVTAVESGRAVALYGSRATAVAKGSNRANSLTLRRLLVWTQDPMDRLRVMASLAEATRGLRGGALASAVHVHLSHGDPATKQFLHRFLVACAAPIYDMVRRWIVDGDLSDPFNEFFVRCDATVGANDLWLRKYKLNPLMRPSFISEETAAQVLLIGKSINFIRVCCKDAEWLMAGGGSDISRLVSGLKYGDAAQMQEVIKATGNAANKRLIDILKGQYKLVEHLTAMKNYMLLGQGDLVQYLIDRLGEELSKPASSVYRHNLMAVLETAIRASNVQYESADVLERLDVRLMDSSPGDKGWDVFSLDYRVTGAITAVIHPTSQDKYLQIFTFLWKIKHVDYSLSRIWRRQMLDDKLLRRVVQVQPAIHRCNSLRNEMHHFLSVFHNYVMFDVLEGSWKTMLHGCETANDLDQLIEAHDAYLAEILEKIQLGPDLRVTIFALFDQIHAFCNALDQLYNGALEETHRRTRAAAEASRASASGAWAETATTDEAAAVADRKLRRFAADMMDTLASIASNYDVLLAELMYALRMATNGAVNLRNLAFRLDFNDFYHKRFELSSPVKRNTPGFARRIKPVRDPSTAKNLVALMDDAA